MKISFVFSIIVLVCLSVIQAQNFGPPLSENLKNYNGFYTTASIKWQGGMEGVSKSQAIKILDAKLRANGIGIENNLGSSYMELKVRVNRETDFDAFLISLTIYGIVKDGDTEIQLVIYNKDTYGVINGIYFKRNQFHLGSIDYVINNFLKDWRATR